MVQTTTNKYVVNPQTNFKGNTAIELVVDTTVLSAPVGAGVTTRVKFYTALTGSTYSSYGTIVSATIPGFGSYELTQYYVPPIQSPVNLVSGQVYNVNYTIKTESSSVLIPASPDVSFAYSQKFLGTEQVTTPAGTFLACKTETTTVSAGVTSSSLGWIVGEGRLKGLFLKSDDGKGTVSVASKLLLNGS